MKRFTLPVAYAGYSVLPVRNMPKNHGVCDTNLRTIVLEVATSKDATRLILWHEFFHALFHELGHRALVDDEAFIQELAVSIMRVRTEQPWL